MLAMAAAVARGLLGRLLESWIARLLGWDYKFSSLLLETTGSGSVKYSMDEYWRV